MDALARAARCGCLSPHDWALPDGTLDVCCAGLSDEELSDRAEAAMVAGVSARPGCDRDLGRIPYAAWVERKTKREAHEAKGVGVGDGARAVVREDFIGLMARKEKADSSRP